MQKPSLKMDGLDFSTTWAIKVSNASKPQHPMK